MGFKGYRVEGLKRGMLALGFGAGGMSKDWQLRCMYIRLMDKIQHYFRFKYP